ncbi:Ankyrin repeat-containing domain protein [Ophiocordyceps sinensis CO18]|nr:Ankyrin repeat-containing domain protein [Ophiocordyceps sinensis CO18]
MEQEEPERRAIPRLILLFHPGTEQIRSLFDLSSLLRCPNLGGKWDLGVAQAKHAPFETQELGESYIHWDRRHVEEKLQQWRGMSNATHPLALEEESLLIARRKPISGVIRGSANGYKYHVFRDLGAYDSSEEVDENDMLPIKAVRNGQQDMVQRLLRGGANVEAKDIDLLRTPLGWAAEGGLDSIAKALLLRNAAVDRCDMKGWTPLLLAVA